MQLIIRLLRFTTPYRWWAMAGLLLYVLVIFANIALMAVSGWFIAAMAVAGAAGVSLNYYTPAAIIRAMAILRTGGRYAERLATHEVTFRLVSELRSWCFAKLEPLAPAKLQGMHSGRLFSALREDTECLEKAYIRVFLPIIGAVIGGAILLVVFGIYDLRFALAIAGLFFVSAILVPFLSRHLAQKHSRAVITEKSAMTEHGIDYLQGMAELQLYGAQERYGEQIKASSQALARAQEKAHAIDQFSEVMVQGCARLAMWVILLLSIPLLQAETLAGADVSMLAFLALASFEIVAPIPAALRLWEEVKISAARLFGLTDQAELLQQRTPKGQEGLAHPDIGFEEVTLHYPNRVEPSLRAVSLQIPYGQHIAITGVTGSGKSSLISVLARLWPASSGQIYLGGTPLPQVDERILRQQIAVAEQQTYLFADTIVGNLRLAKPDASEKEIQHACKIAQIHDFIISQPAGYQTYVGEYGMRLSGGQKRRIGIAQAILKNAPVLVLDEPGEGLDKNTEQALLKATMRHQKGRSLILITHKQACLDQIERVIKIDHGQVAEDHLHENN